MSCGGGIDNGKLAIVAPQANNLRGCNGFAWRITPY
jgi:hypothetical protein